MVSPFSCIQQQQQEQQHEQQQQQLPPLKVKKSISWRLMMSTV